MYKENKVSISIIVAAYNAEQYICKCLDSICSQTFSDLEIIVVDDGSQDRTGMIADEYMKKDDRMIVIHQKNKGAGMAKNEGLLRATGEYVIFVDADDWIEKDTCEEVYRYTQQGKIDMVVFNHNKIFPDKEMKNVRKIKEEIIDIDTIGIEKYVMRYMISFNHEFGAWNKLVKRKIIEENKIMFSDNKKTVYDDNLYCLKLICHVKSICAINRAFYNYNIRSGSISNISHTGEELALGYTEMLSEFRLYICQHKMWDNWKSVFPCLYYSMVFFGLIRLKRFCGVNINGIAKKLGETEYYMEYMEAMNKGENRWKYVIETIPGVGTLKNNNWQLVGLLILTIIQGKLIAANAVKNKFEKVDFWI